MALSVFSGGVGGGGGATDYHTVQRIFSHFLIERLRDYFLESKRR
jgi:hypothetical protein